MKKTFSISKENHEAQLNLSYKLGLWSRTDSLAGDFRKRSGEAFAICADDQARLYRNLADDFEKEAKQLRKDYDEEKKALEDYEKQNTSH